MIFRRSQYANVIDAQLDLFLREHRDVLEDVATRLEHYNAAERDEAEELYGDYVDAVETGTELLADLRDHYAQTLDDPEPYLRDFNRAVAKRLPDVRARDRESVATWSGSRTTRIVGDLQTAALVGRSGSVDWLCFPRFDSSLVLRRAARHARATAAG